MKKSTKKFLVGTVIFISTLIIGFAVTLTSFNLFDTLSDNQMKILFTIDFLSICFVGIGAWYISEGKKSKKAKRKALQKRHEQRLKLQNEQKQKIDLIISQCNIAA